jgi:hypothetical protein
MKWHPSTMLVAWPPLRIEHVLEHQTQSFHLHSSGVLAVLVNIKLSEHKVPAKTKNLKSINEKELLHVYSKDWINLMKSFVHTLSIPTIIKKLLILLLFKLDMK